NRMRAGSTVVCLGQSPSHSRLDTKRIEVISRNQIAPEIFVPSASAAAQIRRRETKGEKTGEDVIPITHISVVRIRQPIALFLADVVTGKPLRRRAGQGPKQKGVEQTERRSVRADAKDERDRGNQRESWSLQQHSRAVAQVLPYGVHYSSPFAFQASIKNRQVSRAAIAADDLARRFSLIILIEYPSSVPVSSKRLSS